MGMGQLVWFVVFACIGIAVYTRASWMPKVLGGSRFQSNVGRIGGVEAATFEGEISLGQPTNFFNRLGMTREGQWDRRLFLAEELGPKIQEGFTNAWAQSMPDSPGLQLVIGFRKIDEAWNARGYGRASNVTDDAHARMHQCGQLAAQAFSRAAATDPADPVPWIGLIRAEHCIQHDDVKQRARAHFAEVMRRDPESVDGIMALGSVLAPHWFGEDGEFLAEARGLAQGAPPGSWRAYAIIHAHLNEWHKRKAFKSMPEGMAYITSPQVIGELRAAYAASLGHPSFRQPTGALKMLNTAAFVLYLAGQKDIVRHELARIAGRYTDVWERMPGAKDEHAGFAAVSHWAATA